MKQISNRIEETAKKGITRRGFLLSGGALFASAAVGMNVSKADAVSLTTATVASIKSASALYVNFSSATAQKNATSTSFSDAVSGASGTVCAATQNLLGDYLPFTGASVSTNTLPAGLEWHSASATKVLTTATNDRIVYRGTTTSSLPNYYGGVRTTANVVMPGQTVLLAFVADLSNVIGDTNASICVSLLRISDQKTTMEARVYNYQESPGTLVTARLSAPAGGTDGYRIVITVKAGSSAAGQSVLVDLSNIVAMVEPPAPLVGSRYAIPPYFRDATAAQDVVLSPQTAGGTYHVVVSTDEFGWACGVTQLSGTTDTVSLQEVFGPSVSMSLNEVYLVATSQWQRGWLDVLSPVLNWTPLRFMNINNSLSSSRPESPNRLSRTTGMPGALSASTSEPNGHIPGLAVPVTTWAASYNPDRLSHVAFQADTLKYIGDSKAGAGVRSEVLPGQPVSFDQDIWLSMWVRATTTLSDPLYDRYAVMFQYRYVKNATGDTSGLSPDLAFEQIPNNRYRLQYRTDNGTSDLSGDASSTAITTTDVGPFNYAVGQWYPLVVHVRFSNSGGGYLGFWFNGQKIIDQPVAVGYNRDLGPALHYGSYKFSDYKSNVEFQHIEHGTVDLSSRISTPLAL